MRATLTLDNNLLEQAKKFSGIQSRPSLINEALRALVAREKARRLAALGGTQPNLKPVPRRRPQ